MALINLLKLRLSPEIFDDSKGTEPNRQISSLECYFVWCSKCSPFTISIEQNLPMNLKSYE